MNRYNFKTVENKWQNYWDKNKSTDNADALVRHLIDHNKNPIDDDGILHLAKVAWRALATLQIYLDSKQ